MSSKHAGKGPDDSRRKAPSENATRYVSPDADFADDCDFDVEPHSSEQPVLSESQDTGLVGVLGEYLLLEPIGSGGMGQVFRAEHRTMNREVALKILSKEIAGSPNVLQQFFAEIRAVAKLMHPNIVTAFDAGSAGDIHYLVMELVRGETLSSLIREQGPISEENAVGVLRQVAEALAYAHDSGIVHRDIKPGNLMVTHRGDIKILDFGLARLGTNASLASSKRFFMGTPEYMSPEQIENADRVDGRSDLYSLGAAFFYLLTGEPMFSGEKMQVARAQLREAPRALFEVRNGLDLRLNTIFQKMVAKTPGDRYESAEALLEHLDSLQLIGAKVLSSGRQSELFSKGVHRLRSDSPTSAGFNTSTLAKKSQVVAIELGLLNSSAAYFDPEIGPQWITQDEGHPRYLRSMLWSSGKDIRIGAEASALRQVDPEKIFHSVQRWIGQGAIQRAFGGETVPPEVVLAALIRQIMNNAASVTEESSSAVVTVPSCYGQLHRRAVRNACRIAGIELVQLLNKPLAAALHWLDLQYRLAGTSPAAEDRKLLVVQLSGTGLDVSVVHAFGNRLIELGNCGHWKLGQMRWQHLLVQYFSRLLQEKTGASIRNDVAAATRLQRTIEIAFGQLTGNRKVDVRFEWSGASLHQTVTQDGLLKVAPELSQSLQQSIARACAIAKIDASEIDQVLLSGGMLLMKPIQAIVSKMIPHAVDMNFVEKTDLALGAAIHAHNLSSLEPDQQQLCLEATGCASYDVALMTDQALNNGPASTDANPQRPKVVIAKGQALPCTYTRTIRPTLVDGQPQMAKQQLIESSSLGRGNWLKLGSIHTAPVVKNDSDTLQLRMSMDSSGILESALICPISGRRSALPASSEPDLSSEDLSHWRDWLEATLAGSG